MRRSGTHFLRVFAEKFKRNVLINFSDAAAHLSKLGWYGYSDGALKISQVNGLG